VPNPKVTTLEFFIAVNLAPPGEILPLPVFRTGDSGYRGSRGAVGLGCRFTV
jgi:hypothetical protein